MALGKLGDKSAIPTLINALNYDSDGVRYNTAFVLAKLGDSHAIPVLISALSDFGDDVQRNAVEALAKFGEQGFSALINALNYDNMLVGSAVVKALGELGDSRAIPALINTLDDERDDVAAEALVKLGNSQTIPTLINTLNNNDSYQGAAHSLIRLVEALGECGDKCAIPMLIKVLGDANLDFCYPFEYPHKSLRLETVVAILKLSR